MEAKEVIKFYNKGFLNEEGELNKEVIEKYGITDGCIYAEAANRNTPCGDEMQLIESVNTIMEMERVLEPHETTYILMCMAESYDEDLAEEIHAMGTNDAILKVYNKAFLNEFAKIAQDRYTICFACKL